MGISTLGVTVNTDAGDSVANEQVTIVKEETGDQVFQGTTDNAGQIDVTLPQDEYEVIVQDQEMNIKLDEDKDIAFTVKSPELPKA